MKTIWENISLKQIGRHYLNIGDLHLWAKYQNQEIWIAYGYDGEMDVEPSKENMPDSITWSRWAVGDGGDEISIQPAFSDLPLVVHSQYNLKIRPNTSINIFTSTPVWVCISLMNENKSLTEVSSVPLSRTWFGNRTEGELCYHLPTRARREISEVSPDPYWIRCPITISNKSGRVLDFEQFCFRVERLCIYGDDEKLWADETKIIFNGDEQHSDIIMTGKLPENIDGKQLVAKPRKKIPKSLATRTFKRLFESKVPFE